MNLTWEQVNKDMDNCPQTSTQSVAEHGHSVWRWYRVLNEILAYGYDDPMNNNLIGKERFKLPSWWSKYEEALAWERHSSGVVYWYTTYHDCGKPYCREVDEEGRQHFSEHAKKSYEVWCHLTKNHPKEILDDRVYGGEKIKAEVVADLILHDMDIHTMKAKDIDPLIERLSSRSIATLLLVAICEIHSNAEMFGGIESESFKIKWKQIDRRGKAICKKLFGEDLNFDC